MQKIDIKNAATIILLRGSRENPQVLMGQRGKNASFMPNKFVFPGGALDPSDSEIDFEEKISEKCLEKLKLKAEKFTLPNVLLMSLTAPSILFVILIWRTTIMQVLQKSLNLFLLKRFQK